MVLATGGGGVSFALRMKRSACWGWVPPPGQALSEGQVDVPPFLARVDLSTECTWTAGRAI